MKVYLGESNIVGLVDERIAVVIVSVARLEGGLAGADEGAVVAADRAAAVAWYGGRYVLP